MSLGRYAGGAATTALALLVVGFGVHQFDDRLRFRFSLDHVTLSWAMSQPWSCRPARNRIWSRPSGSRTSHFVTWDRVVSPMPF
jgi:hypothetical protein